MHARSLVVLLAGCGRIAFDPRGIGSDAPVGDALTDAAIPGLVMYFPFDDTIRDEITGVDATCRNGCPTYLDGHIGHAAEFHGTECLSIPDAPRYRLARFTIAAWAKPFATRGAILSRPYMGASTSLDTREVWVESGMWSFAVNNTTQQAVTGINAFHHVAVVFNGQLMTTYLDGAQFAAPAILGAATYTAEPELVGCDVDANVQVFSFTGLIDEVRMYDYPLTAVEIAALAQ